MRTVIALVSVAVVLAVIAINVWAWMYYGTHEETVSATVGRWVRRWPVIAFVIGGVAGHLCNDNDARPIMLVGLALAWLWW